MNHYVSMLIALTFAFSAATLAGCNTLQGAGQDLERAGQELEEEVNENTD